MTHDAWPGESDPRATLSLWDYRRKVADIYGAVRGADPVTAWMQWRDDRDDLFAHHPQSALAPGARGSFESLPYFAYDPSLRVIADVVESPKRQIALAHSGDGSTRAHAFGRARFTLAGATRELTLYWLDQYGGGVFLPFRDATNGSSTYGGGRYLLDTAKGADLGRNADRLILDFNLSYHPSCVHDDRWSCPLSPIENRLTVPIEAGERL